MTSRRTLGWSALLLATVLGCSCSGESPATRDAEGTSAGSRAVALARRLATTRTEVPRGFRLEGGSLRAPAHAGLTAVFDDKGLGVEWGAARIGLPTTGVRCDGRSLALTKGPAALAAVAPNRAERALGGGVREWVEAGPRGVEQGFDVDLPSCATLEFDVQPVGSTATLEGNDVLLTGRDGSALKYAGLTAIDAAQRLLPSRMEVADGRIVLHVDARGARWPVVVDPLVYAARGRLGPGTTGVSGGYFGQSVAVSGTTIAIGAPGEAVGASAMQGAVYVFTQSAGAWSLQQRIVAPDGAPSDFFGKSVALSGDTLVAGSAAATVGGGANQGVAYVFVRSGASWAQQQKLTAADGAANDYFGSAVAISANTLIVGAPVATLAGHASQGAAYVFARSGAVWSQLQKLTAADGATGDRFGSSVGLSGSTALLGAPGAAVGTNVGQGAAYVFTVGGGSWSQQARLTAADGAAGDSFGQAVAVDGTTALVGAPVAAVGANAAQGAGYPFVQSGASWTAQPRLTASDGAANDQFATSAALAGSTAVFGAPRATGLGGAAYAFVPNAGAWTQQPRLVAADGAAGDQRGGSVAVSGGTVVAGAIGGGAPPTGKPHEGAAYVFAQVLSQGSTCAADGDCASGHCADGVCCDTACNGGACQACSKAKGASADGACTVLPATVTCRAAAGACDAAETCDGFNAGCPADRKLGPVTACRPEAGPCDVAEVCDGTSNDCPADVKRGAETTCRASAGVCDLAATCDGVKTECPANPKRKQGTQCRAAVGDCDQAGLCDGASADCPPDVHVADGERCAGGVCQAGICTTQDAGASPPPDAAGTTPAAGGGAGGGGCTHAPGAPGAPWSIGLLFGLALALRSKQRG
jgi:hypothetical protein